MQSSNRSKFLSPLNTLTTSRAGSRRAPRNRSGHDAPLEGQGELLAARPGREHVPASFDRKEPARQQLNAGQRGLVGKALGALDDGDVLSVRALLHELLDKPLTNPPAKVLELQRAARGEAGDGGAAEALAARLTRHLDEAQGKLALLNPARLSRGDQAGLERARESIGDALAAVPKAQREEWLHFEKPFGEGTSKAERDSAKEVASEEKCGARNPGNGEVRCVEPRGHTGDHSSRPDKKGARYVWEGEGATSEDEDEGLTFADEDEEACGRPCSLPGNEKLSCDRLEAHDGDHAARVKGEPPLRWREEEGGEKEQASDVPLLNDADFERGFPGVCYVCGKPITEPGKTTDYLGEAHNDCLNGLPPAGRKKRDRLQKERRQASAESVAHTPGPWGVERMEADDGRSKRKALRVVADDDVVVATITYDRDDGEAEEGAYADAALMSAAPTMHKTLRELRQMLVDMKNGRKPVRDEKEYAAALLKGVDMVLADAARMLHV